MRRLVAAMRQPAVRTVLRAGIFCALFASIAAGAARAEAQSPSRSAVSSASGYSVRPACSSASGGARCLALELIPETAAAGARARGAAPRSAGDRSRAAEGCAEHPAREGCRGLRPEDLHGAYSLPLVAPTLADDRDRRFLRRPDRRKGPQGLRRRIRPAAVHQKERLLEEDQPGRQAQATEGGPRLGRGDRDGCRDGTRDLPELSHPAGGGGLRGRHARHGRSRSCRERGCSQRGERDFELLDGRRAGHRQCRVRSPRHRDHGGSRRRRLPQLGARLARSGPGGISGFLTTCGRSRWDAPARRVGLLGKRERLERRWDRNRLGGNRGRLQ